MEPNKIRVVCFFARCRGVNVLRGLLDDGRFSIVGLVVHSKEPKSEDPMRGLRPEYAEFCAIAKENNLPMHVVDTRKEAGSLEFMREIKEFDLLISVSWKFLIPDFVFTRARIEAINVHRGKLPQYAGLEPIKQALNNGDTEISLIVHRMIKELDAGEILVEKKHVVSLDRELDLDQNIEQIKKDMLPMYARAVIEAMNIVIDEFYEKC